MKPYDSLESLTDRAAQSDCEHYWEPCHTAVHPGLHGIPVAYRVKTVYCKRCLKEREL